MMADDHFGSRRGMGRKQGEWFTDPLFTPTSIERHNMCPVAWSRLGNMFYDYYKGGGGSFHVLSCPSSSGGAEVPSRGGECVTLAKNTNTILKTHLETCWGYKLTIHVISLAGSFIGQFKSVGDILWFTTRMGPFHFHPYLTTQIPVMVRLGLWVRGWLARWCLAEGCLAHCGGVFHTL